MEETSITDEKIIELTQIVQDDQDSPATKDASDASSDAPALSNTKKETAPGQASSVSRKDIPVELMESVIEKWVEKEFQNKIEPLMQEVIERVIEREIRRIGQGIEEKMDKIQMVSSEAKKKP
ncbi:MAG: hypothetical protein CSB28_01705 [Desulfobacterales bacterium]|nr:MAG: hypothetical protein CSB28_01705 [Desulfobacterales bacterium]